MINVAAIQQDGYEVPTWLVRAPLQPDEFANGYFGRLATLNGFDSCKRLFARATRMREQFEPATKIAFLSAASGLPEESVVNQHMLTPFTKVFGPNISAPCVEDDVSIKHSIPKHLALPSHSKLCTSCVYEDHKFWGFSYWRRSHQLPGIEWCDKHQENLLFYPPEAFELAPSVALEQLRPIKFPPVEYGSPVVATYGEIATTLLNRPTQWEPRKLQHLLNTRIHQNRLSQDHVEEQPKLLSDIAWEKCPQDWLIRLMPAFKSKKDQMYFLAVDSLSRMSCPGLPVPRVLGLALMFSSADDAVNSMESVELRTSDIKGLTDNLPVNFWDGPEATNVYIKYRGDITRIASELQLSERYVLKRLRYVGLPIFPKINQHRIFNALAEFFSGSAVSEACAKHSIKPKTLEAILREDTFRIRAMFQGRTPRTAAFVSQT
jgi:hypothetical protein